MAVGHKQVRKTQLYSGIAAITLKRVSIVFSMSARPAAETAI
jgi:hypothetical protein